MKWSLRSPSPPESVIHVPANAVILIIPRDFLTTLLTVIFVLTLGGTAQITLNVLHPPSVIVQPRPQPSTH